jgi:hypothetical protein
VAFITDDQLKTAVADSQGATGVGALPSYWPSAVPRANRQAHSTLRSRLLNRGFTAAQVTAWGATDDGQDWNTRLGVCAACWAVSKSAEDRGEAFRREWEALLLELDDLAVVIDGELVTPTGAGANVSYGGFLDTDDIHTIDDVL